MTDTVQWRIKRRRRRKPINPAILFALPGLMLLLGIFEQSAQSPGSARIIRTVPESYSFADYTVPVVKEVVGKRVVYPYSVVRGGVHDREELLREIKRDPVVADHYSDFHASEFRIVRVRDEKQVHVSYRIDSKVYWTTRKITLARGEALISDGQNLARVRCGNRVSPVPQEPTLPEEPSTEVFEQPNIVVDTDLFIPPTIPDYPTVLFEEFRDPIILEPPEGKLISEDFWPIYPPGSFTPPVFIVEPELPEVPEPNTLILVASALAAYLLLRKTVLKR